MNVKTSSFLKVTALALLIGTFFLNGCAATRPAVDQPAGSAVVVDQPPPLPVEESMTVSPGAGFVWVPGAWSWRSQWVWDQGHWAHPPQAGAIWIAPRYEERGAKHVFIAGGWKIN